MLWLCGCNDARTSGYTLPPFFHCPSLGDYKVCSNDFRLPALNAFRGGSRFLVVGILVGNTTTDLPQEHLKFPQSLHFRFFSYKAREV